MWKRIFSSITADPTSRSWKCISLIQRDQTREWIYSVWKFERQKEDEETGKWANSWPPHPVSSNFWYIFFFHLQPFQFLFSVISAGIRFFLFFFFFFISFRAGIFLELNVWFGTDRFGHWIEIWTAYDEDCLFLFLFPHGFALWLAMLSILLTVSWIYITMPLVFCLITWNSRTQNNVCMVGNVTMITP